MILWDFMYKYFEAINYKLNPTCGGSNNLIFALENKARRSGA